MRKKFIMQPDGSMLIETPDGARMIFALTTEEICAMNDALETHYAVEDIRQRAADLIEDADLSLDISTLTPEVTHKLARELLDRKGNSSTINEVYYYLIEEVLEDFAKGRLKYE